MVLSALLLTILEQAKEPLHCLHGAGYFTPEEWVQLDLIMNKEYIWTTGPPNKDMFFQSSINKTSNLVDDNSTFFMGGHKDMPNLDAISLYAPIEQNLSDINVSPESADASWRVPHRNMPEKPFESLITLKSESRPSIYSGEQRRSTGYTSTLDEEYRRLSTPLQEKNLRYTPSAGGSDSKLQLSSSARKMKSISAWTSDVQNNTQRQTQIKQPVAKASSVTSQFKRRSTQSTRSTATRDQLKESQNDVDIFETNNAAEWDDVMSHVLDSGGSQDNEESSNLVDENLGKIQNLNVQEGQNKKIRQQGSSTTSFSPRTVSHGSLRGAQVKLRDAPRLARHKESKDRKNSKDNDTGSQQKTRVCWFWAESPGGCRYKPDECLNLHVKPTPNAMLRQHQKDSKSVRSSGNRINTAKPLTCWSWASTGTCTKGDKCKDVHGWVVGGVASGPKNDSNLARNLQKVTAEPKKKEAIAPDTATGAREVAIPGQKRQETNGMELIDVRSDDHDRGDQTLPKPSILMNLDSSTVTSSIHA